MKHVPTMAAFETFVARELLPWLEEQEIERRRVLGRAARRSFPAFLLALICAIAAFSVGSPLLRLFAFLAAPAFAVWGIFLFFPALFWAGAFQKALLERVYNYFGFTSARDVPHGYFAAFGRLALLPAGPRYELMAYDSGQMRGLSCEVATARLHMQRMWHRHVSRATPRGVLLARFPFPKTFDGVTAILPDLGGAVNAVRPRPDDGDRMVARVRLDNPDFEKVFEVFSSNQISARYLLTPAFMERLLELRRQTDGEMRLAFARGALYVVLAGEQSYFGSVSVSADIRDAGGMYALAADMMRLDDLVGILKLDAQTAV